MKKNKRKKVPSIVHAGFPIREVRPAYFMVDIQYDGKRERKCFKSMAEAKTFAEISRRRIQNEGAGAMSLTPTERLDASSALQLLKGRATLKTAAELWILYNPETSSIIVQELIEKFIDSITRAGLRSTTIRERKYMLNRLAQVFGQTTCQAITTAMLDKFFDDLNLKGSTRDTYRRCYRVLFQFAVREKIIPSNPAADLLAIRLDEKLPTPFKPKDVAAIMASAEQTAPLMVPSLAVQFFAGLRPGEAMGLKWQDINFDEKFIRVQPETSKVRAARIVDINDTLFVWLMKYRKQSENIGITTKSQFGYYMHKKGVIAKAGVKWIQDGPRKTFATMHMATFQDAGKTAVILGHVNGADVLYKHYRGLATKKEADQYWKIKPAKQDRKLIQFPA